ncbi:MAG TPA: hypothetical protein VI032_07995 [Burkholderiaceae bacterium]
MSRTLQALRTSITVGAFLMACGALHSAHAADATVQRLAMACVHGSDAAGCKPAPMQARQVAVAQRAEMTVAKAPARRVQELRTASSDSDGSRFTYDSCGCSN